MRGPTSMRRMDMGMLLFAFQSSNVMPGPDPGIFIRSARDPRVRPGDDGPVYRCVTRPAFRNRGRRNAGEEAGRESGWGAAAAVWGETSPGRPGRASPGAEERR